MVVTAAAVEGATSVGNGGGSDGRRSDERGSSLSSLVARTRGRRGQRWCGFLIRSDGRDGVGRSDDRGTRLRGAWPPEEGVTLAAATDWGGGRRIHEVATDWGAPDPGAVADLGVRAREVGWGQGAELMEARGEVAGGERIKLSYFHSFLVAEKIKL
jgi:hypothetical protein